MPNLAVSEEHPAGDVIYHDIVPVYRDVRLFVQKIKLIASQYGLSVYWIIRTCFLGSARRWSEIREEELENTKFNDFCQALLNRFDKEYEPERQEQALLKHQAEEARLAKERAAAEAFVCRRCPAKYPSNTQLHKHIDEHHTKSAKPITTPAPAPAPSDTQDHKTPTPPPPPKEPLTMSPPVVILDQTPIAPPAKPVQITAPITPPSTPVTSPQITWAAIAAKPAIPIVSLPTPPPSPPQTPVLLHRKPYMTMDDLFAKFAGKIKKNSPGTIQENASSPALRQMHITSYYKPAKSPKSPKSSKSKVFTISPSSAPAKPLPANHTARTPDYHRLAPKHHIIKAHCSSHTCRFCNGTFASNNALHRHLRLAHLVPKPKQPSENSALHGRMPQAKLSVFRGHTTHCINNPASPASRQPLRTNRVA